MHILLQLGCKHEFEKILGVIRMSFYGQEILPVVREMRGFEKLMKSNYQYIVILGIHIGQLRSVMKVAEKQNKKILLHADLVSGLKHDEYAAEFLCKEIRPEGIISTNTKVIQTAKKKGIMGIQRLFLLDSMALDTNLKMLRKSNPDYIEALPGVVPDIITEVKEATGIPILAGGLIRTEEDMKASLHAGADAITTSKKSLWKEVSGSD